MELTDTKFFMENESKIGFIPCHLLHKLHVETVF